MTSLLRNAGLLAVLATPACAHAQGLDYAAFEQLFGEPVTASATGSPQRESQVAAAMIIITAEEIRRSGARDIPGVLQHVAGVDVRQHSHDHSDVSIRGYNQAFSPRLLVLVDGRQVYADHYGFTPWSTVPVELAAIRQIEVVKGPSSALFGFNAVGGVINIVTYDPIDEPVNRVSLAAGTQDVRQVSVVSAWQPVESLGLQLSAGHRTGDDFSTQMQPGDLGARRGNDRSAVSLDLLWHATETLRIGAEATYSEAEHAEFTPIYTLAHSEYRVKSARAYGDAETRLGLVQASVYTNWIEVASFDAGASDPWVILDSRVTVAELQSISKIATDHTLRLSGEYRHNTMATSPFPGGNVYYDVAAIGGMWEWRGVPSVTLTAAARVDYWSLGRNGSLPQDYPLTKADWDRSHTAPSFNLGVVWQASDVDTWRFLAGRGVQLPNLFNLGGFLFPIPPVGWVGGIPDLDPTVVDNYEISWDRDLAVLEAQLRVSGFFGQSREIVAIGGDARPQQGLFFLPVNIGDSRTYGIELALEGVLREEWRWSASYLGQAVDDRFAPEFPAEATLTDYEKSTPRHVLKGTLGWASERWEVDGFLRYVSSSAGFVSDGSEAGTGLLMPIPGHFALDGRIGYALNDRVTMALTGRNLTRSHQRQTSAPEVERIVFATFSVDFGAR